MLQWDSARLTACMMALAACAFSGPSSADPPAAPATQPAAPAVLYSNGFENGAGAEWSATSTETTPQGKRVYLGQFANEAVTLTVRKLPPHQLVRVSFDLLLIRTWHGSHPKWGPDIWELAVADGPTLLRATFSNVDFYSGCRQSFPDWVGAGQYAPRTGAAETNSLGYAFQGPPEIAERIVDSVYRLSFTFPHSKGEIALSFSASGLEKENSETWGLDNVSVAVLPKVAPLGEEEMKALWELLAAEDGQRAFEAVWKLIAAGEPAVEFLSRQLEPYVADPARISALVRQLGDDEDWRVREKATADLIEMGKGAEKHLKDAQAKLPKDASLEFRLRLEHVLQQIGVKTISPLDKRLYGRAKCVLRVIGSRQAVRTLRNLPVDIPQGDKAEADADQPPGAPRAVPMLPAPVLRRFQVLRPRR